MAGLHLKSLNTLWTYFIAKGACAQLLNCWQGRWSLFFQWKKSKAMDSNREIIKWEKVKAGKCLTLANKRRVRARVFQNNFKNACVVSITALLQILKRYSCHVMLGNKLADSPSFNSHVEPILRLFLVITALQ